MSTCPDCTTLQTRVEHLEKELGIRRRDQEIAALVHRLEVTATQARVLLRLYAAGGKLLSTDALMTIASTTSAESLKVTMSRLRKVLGDDTIVSGAYGEACYALSPKGLALVLGAIEPFEVQRTVRYEDIADLV